MRILRIKQPILLLSLLWFVFLLWSCNTAKVEELIPESDITIANAKSDTLIQGSSLTLIAKVLVSEELPDSTVMWSSSDTAIATVDTIGVVTAIAGDSVAIVAISTFDTLKADTILLIVNYRTVIIGDLTITRDNQSDFVRIKRITGNLKISGNVTMLKMDSLTTVGGHLSLFFNSNLTSFSGLENLTNVGGLSIFVNSALRSLRGLENLTSVGGYVNISTNGNLRSLRGLENLTSVGGLSIYRNGNLRSLRELENLTTVGGNLRISFSPGLTSLSGLDSLTTVGGNLRISFSPGLTSLSGLDSLTTVGGKLRIYRNGNLRSLSGLENLTTVGGNLRISFSPGLTSLSGLDSLTTVGGNLIISNNAALKDYCALKELSITGAYQILRNLYNPSQPELVTETGCSRL